MGVDEGNLQIMYVEMIMGKCPITIATVVEISRKAELPSFAYKNCGAYPLLKGGIGGHTAGIEIGNPIPIGRGTKGGGKQATTKKQCTSTNTR